MSTDEKTAKRKDIAKTKSKELTELLKKIGIPQKSFFEDFYREKVDKNADAMDLEDHYQRVKSSIKRNAEVSTLYLHYAQSKYSNRTINDASQKAAHDFFTELSTRVSAISLADNIGQDSAALKSLHSLFKNRRKASKKHGIGTMLFFKHSQPFMDETIRPFTTKWHKKLDKSKINQDFREELSKLTIATQEYIKKLEVDFQL